MDKIITIIALIFAVFFMVVANQREMSKDKAEIIFDRVVHDVRAAKAVNYPVCFELIGELAGTYCIIHIKETK